MYGLCLASKALYDVDVLRVTKENEELKKATARRLFYHGIDEDLRELNAHVILCDCPKCLDMMGNNYPSQPIADDELGDGDVFFVPNDKGAKGGSMYGMLATKHGGDTLIPIVRLTRDSRSSKDCALMAWFARECERHGLPKPSYYFGIRSFSLWIELGHHGQRYEPPDSSWRDKVEALSYRTQVERVYKGLLHDSLGGTLLRHGKESSTQRNDEDAFEDWFRVGCHSLLPS